MAVYWRRCEFEEMVEQSAARERCFPLRYQRIRLATPFPETIPKRGPCLFFCLGVVQSARAISLFSSSSASDGLRAEQRHVYFLLGPTVTVESHIELRLKGQRVQGKGEGWIRGGIWLWPGSVSALEGGLDSPTQ